MLKGQVHGFSRLSWHNSQESKWMNEWIHSLCKNGLQCFWLLFEKQTWNIVNVSFIFLSTQWKHYDMDGLWEIRTLSSDILQVKHSCKELLLVQKLHLNFSHFFFLCWRWNFLQQLHYKCDWKVNTASETPSALISLILNDLELHIMSCVLLCVQCAILLFY